MTYDAAAAACTCDGCSNGEEEDAFDPRSESSFAATFELSDAIKEPTSDEPDVSLHAIKQKAVTAAWGKARSALLKAVVESNAMPENQCCISCSDSATYCCIQCASWAYCCHQCYSEVHSRIDFFHTERFGRWEYHSFHGTLW